jgi:hypothetical protein
MILINSFHDNTEAIINRLEMVGRATETILADLDIPYSGIVIFIEDDEISFVCEYAVQRRIATNRKLVTLSNPLRISEPEQLGVLEDRFPRHRQRVSAMRKALGVHRITPGLSNNIIELLIERNPDFQEWYRSASAELHISFDVYPAAILEYDAIALALKLANFREVSFSYEDHQRGNIFERLVAQEMTEDQIISRDYSVLGKRALWSDSDPGISGKEFFSPESQSRVSIIYANRTKLENVLGVDLIIHNISHKSIILIQYKRMVYENGE